MNEPIERPIDPADPDSPTQAEETGTIAEFAAKYAKPEPSEPVADDDAEPQPAAEQRSRHRSKSQQAKPDDAKAIADYTKRLREAEAQLGVKIDRQEGESERVYNLRRRAETTEALLKRAAPAAPAAVAKPAAVVSEFTEKEPLFDAYANEAEPLTAWMRAMTAYQRKLEKFDEQKGAAAALAESNGKAWAAARDHAYKTYGESAKAFSDITPDYKQVMDASNIPVPPLLETAFIVDPVDGPKYAYYLAKQYLSGKTQMFDELFLAADGKVVNNETVAAMQRLIKSRLSAAVTGSATTPHALSFPPRPPNPVRTGRTRSTSDASPDPDNLSMDGFAKAYPTRGRR
jgi:hypothetical protein